MNNHSLLSKQKFIWISWITLNLVVLFSRSEYWPLTCFQMFSYPRNHEMVSVIRTAELKPDLTYEYMKLNRTSAWSRNKYKRAIEVGNEKLIISSMILDCREHGLDKCIKRRLVLVRRSLIKKSDTNYELDEKIIFRYDGK